MLVQTGQCLALFCNLGCCLTLSLVVVDEHRLVAEDCKAILVFGTFCNGPPQRQILDSFVEIPCRPKGCAEVVVDVQRPVRSCNTHALCIVHNVQTYDKEVEIEGGGTAVKKTRIMGVLHFLCKDIIVKIIKHLNLKMNN